MAVPLLDLAAQHEAIAAEVEAKVLSVLRSGRYILGPCVAEFERLAALECNTPHALGVSSGTDALLVALQALGVGPGHEVIVPAFSFFATAGSVYRVGARPVFADIDPATFNLDPSSLARHIGPRTRAVIPVHLFGQCADMVAINEIAAAHGLYVIEDAAQAFGAEHLSRRAGSLGHVGCFSFFPSKNLGGAGDGGLVTTQDASLHARMTMLRVHGASRRYHHELVGGNFRLDEIQAAILSVKLKYLPAWTEARRRNAAYYRERLQDLALEGLLVLPIEAEGRRHIFNQFTIRVPSRRDEVVSRLRAAQVGTEIYYPVPLHLQPCFAHLGGKVQDCPEAERASQEVLSLPVHPYLTQSQLDEVCDALRAALRP